MQTIKLKPKCGYHDCRCRSWYRLSIYRCFAGRCERHGENTTNNTPLPQISPLEGRLNLRYVQDKYTLGALLRVVDGQSRISEREGNIVGYDVKESSGFGVLSLNGSPK